MWRNLSLNCLPEDRLDINSFMEKLNEEEEKQPSHTLLESTNMDNLSRIKETLKNGAPDFTGLTQKEMAENCKIILEMLPEVVKNSKTSQNSYVENLYHNFAKYICNTCKSELDKTVHNPEERARFALHRFVEMEANKRQNIVNGDECPPFSNTELLCFEYHMDTDFVDILSLNEDVASINHTNSFDDSTDFVEMKTASLFQNDFLDFSINSNNSQSTPKKQETEMSFKFGCSPLPSSDVEVDKEIGSNNECSTSSSTPVTIHNGNMLNFHVIQYGLLAEKKLSTANASREVNLKSCLRKKPADSDNNSATILNASNGSISISFCDSSAESISFPDGSSGISECCDPSLLRKKVPSVEFQINIYNDTTDESDLDDYDLSWSEEDSDVELSCNDLGLFCSGGLFVHNLISVQQADPVEDESTKYLKEANDTWKKHANIGWIKGTPCKVRFHEVVDINEWDDTDDNRKDNPWIQAAIDRMHFKKRIQDVNSEIGWIFDKPHLDKIINLHNLQDV